MFNVGGPEILVILVVALIVLGPQRLPQAARQVGKAMAEFRRVTTGFQAEVRDALNDSLVAPAAPAPDPAAVAAMHEDPAPPEVAPEPLVDTATAAAPAPDSRIMAPEDDAPIADTSLPPEAPAVGALEADDEGPAA